MRIGWFDSMPNFPTSISVKRAISIAKVKLEKEGYILVPFKISKEEHDTMSRIFFACTCIAFVGQFI